MKISAVLLHPFLLVTGFCLAPHSSALGADFDPEEVFAGNSSGKGTLKLFLGEPRPFTVESIGALRADGAFELDQTIRFQGRPAESRTWVMHRIGPDTYSATLTDAAGPVEISTEGSRMIVRYPLKRWGLVMHQTLDLADDRRTIANHGRIKLLGIPVGWLQETILLGR
jgi:hypothetical protein